MGEIFYLFNRNQSQIKRMRALFKRWWTIPLQQPTDQSTNSKKSKSYAQSLKLCLQEYNNSWFVSAMCTHPVVVECADGSAGLGDGVVCVVPDTDAVPLLHHLVTHALLSFRRRLSLQRDTCWCNISHTYLNLMFSRIKWNLRSRKMAGPHYIDISCYFSQTYWNR